MGPKIYAACGCVERTGRPAALGALDELAEVLAGSAGTRIEPHDHGWACDVKTGAQPGSAQR